MDIECEKEMEEVMKAVMVTKPGKLEIREVEKPKVADEDLLLRVNMCGVCGTDVHMFYSEKPYPWMEQSYPYTPGHEIVGTIEEVGENFDGHDFLGEPITVGDRIAPYPPIPCGKCYYCRYLMQPNLCKFPPLERKTPPLRGGFAEMKYIPKEQPIFKIPKDMPLEVAVLVEPFATALRAVERSFQPGVPDRFEGMGPGKTVVVQGSGTIGLLSVIVSKLCGASKVIVVGAPEFRLKMCEEFGADISINIEEVKAPEDRIDEVKKQTPFKEGADVVIEAAGVPQAFAEGIQMVRRGGTYVEVGHFTYQGEVMINPQILCYKDIHLIGSWGYSAPEFGPAIRILNSLRRKIPLHKIVTHKFPLEKALEAFETARKWNCMKAVIVP